MAVHEPCTPVLAAESAQTTLMHTRAVLQSVGVHGFDRVRIVHAEIEVDLSAGRMTVAADALEYGAPPPQER